MAMSKQRNVAIVGRGTAPEAAIVSALNDGLNKGDAIHFPFVSDNDTDDLIIDYALEEGFDLVLYYAEGEKIPPVLSSNDKIVTQKTRNPLSAAVRASDVVFYRWEEDKDPEEQMGKVFDALPEGALILELTNGLAPISLNQEIPEAKEADVQHDEGDDERFTKAELEIMTPAAVKRYGARLGCEAQTKTGIIKELFPDDEEDEPEQKPAHILAREAHNAKKEEQDITQEEAARRGSSNPADRFMLSLTNVKPTDENIVKIEDYRTIAKGLATYIFAEIPESRERSLALTHLEETVMWGVKALVLAQ